MGDIVYPASITFVFVLEPDDVLCVEWQRQVCAASTIALRCTSFVDMQSPVVTVHDVTTGFSLFYMRSHKLQLHPTVLSARSAASSHCHHALASISTYVWTPGC